MKCSQCPVENKCSGAVCKYEEEEKQAMFTSFDARKCFVSAWVELKKEGWGNPHSVKNYIWKRAINNLIREIGEAGFNYQVSRTLEFVFDNEFDYIFN